MFRCISTYPKLQTRATIEVQSIKGVYGMEGGAFFAGMGRG